MSEKIIQLETLLGSKYVINPLFSYTVYKSLETRALDGYTITLQEKSTEVNMLSRLL